MRIRCTDLPGPHGPYVALPDGVYEMDDEVAEALAQNAMMLSLDPDYAEHLIEEGEATTGGPA
jgi:hypothetical protein